MQVQSQERLPFTPISPEYVATVIARGFDLLPALSVPSIHSLFLPNGWQEGSGIYIAAMIDLAQDDYFDHGEQMVLKLSATLYHQQDTAPATVEHEFVLLPSEYRVDDAFAKNVYVPFGPLDLTGLGILSRADFTIERDMEQDTWPGTATVAGLLLLTPCDSVGSTYPERRT